jgi:hypothetical protein
MTLRARKPAGQGTSSTNHATSPDRKKAYQSHPVGEPAAAASSSADASLSSPESTPEMAPAAAGEKKLPRVILKVGPRPEN